MDCRTHSRAIHGGLLAQLFCIELETAMCGLAIYQVSHAILATSGIKDPRPQLLVLSSKRESPRRTGIFLHMPRACFTGGVSCPEKAESKASDQQCLFYDYVVIVCSNHFPQT